MQGLKIIAGLGAAVILTACGANAASQSPAAPPSTGPSTSAASSGGGNSNGSGNGSSTGTGGGVDGANSGGTPAGAGHKPKKGVISGTMSMVGSSLPGSGDNQPDPRPISGTVTLTSLRHGTFTAPVDSSGHFSIKLPIGSYHLIGHSPKVQLPCIRPSAVNVGVDEDVQVQVNCITP